MKGIYSMEELMAQAAGDEARLQKQVRIEEGHIIIDVDYEYNIDLDRCDTLDKILGWVAHLCEKTWMTIDVLERFIRVAAAHHELELPNP